MDKLKDLTGVSFKNKSLTINHAQTELDKKKKTYNSINLSLLPDKGEKLKKQIDELENLLQTLTLEVTVNDEDTSNIISPVSSIKVSIEKQPTKPPEKVVSDEKQVKSTSDNVTKAKNALSQIENLPFCKVSHDIKKYSSFNSLSNKNELKSDKAIVTDSPSFKNWRQPKEVHKILLTEPKPLVQKPTTKSNLLNQFTVNPVFQVNEENVKKIHDSLTSYPDDNKEESEPENLKSTLLLHQKRGLAWMMWREEQDPKGGILADDMGLGKTVSMIALILKQKERKDFYSLRDHELECRGTLIVCTLSVLHQWYHEVVKHCETDALKVQLYHGTNRDKNVKHMKSHDVVLTTYDTVLNEKKETNCKNITSPLFCLKWERIILDEAHTIKNHNSQTTKAIFSLKSFRKWAVTGTPIHNVFKDFYALVKFLQYSPFDDPKKFKALTDGNSEKNKKCRNLLVKSILLRRTKDEKHDSGEPLIEMKSKSLKLHYIDLSEQERQTYDTLNSKIKNKFSLYFKKSQKLSSLLVILLRLQQCCNHLCLLKEELELPNDSSDVADALSSLSITESLSSSADGNLDLPCINLGDERLNDITLKSTKIKKLLKELHKISESSDNKDKSVIVSQWTSMLDVIAYHLKQENIAYHLIAGSTKVEDRQKFAHDFNNNEDGAKVMLLSLKAGGVGLNLIGANHLFLTDLHWNPALEIQACDRIHRVGQKKDVVIHKFICRNTIEEKINELQNIKRRIASNAMNGAKHVSSGLTIDDYKMIFGIL